MRSVTVTDWAVLDFLSVDRKPIRPLLARYPKATIYHRLRVLQVQGLVAKHGTEYALTSAGQQVKADRETEIFSEGLMRVYPPLRDVPTPQHRAMLELALAALVLRQHTDQEERHAGFLFLGPTLTWKTSAAWFLCFAAGVDPSTHVVDLASETGKSLWIRRGASGEIVTERSLLDEPLIVLDELQLADPAVRRAIAPLLSGRRRVPLENSIRTISPVPIMTMNTRP